MLFLSPNGNAGGVSAGAGFTATGAELGDGSGGAVMGQGQMTKTPYKLTATTAAVKQAKRAAGVFQ